MMRSLYAGVSGIKIHQTRMDVIGNNIANINTVGFKSSRTTFADVLSQTQVGASAPSDTRGGISPRQIGLGAAVASIDLLTADGSPQATGKNTDVALSGNALFVLNNGGQTIYTRDGAFEFDAEGNYVLPGSGLKVQGWNGIDGVINTNALTEDINVRAGKTMPAKETTSIDYNGNLNASDLIITGISYIPRGGAATDVPADQGIYIDGNKNTMATLTLSDGSTRRVTSGYYQVGYSIPVTTVANVYDAEGGTHSVTILMDRNLDATNNQWRVYLSPVGELDDTAENITAPPTTVTIEDGATTLSMDVTNIYFNSDGSLNTTTDPKTENGTTTLTFTPTQGIGATTPQQVTVGFSGLTQYTGNTSAYPTTDGNAYGILQSISIDSSGVIQGTYTNGVIQDEAQIAVAQFVNFSGLTKIGTSTYQESNNSGQANIRTVDALGVSITPSALEMSNVDLANEFADMIVTQRGFQSNSKIMTVGDEMLETLINMKR
ncbi:MAG: flagellar hook protein FlgE [Selenomonadaceae bacterium]|nr:flagellar hook protein FlgE [Selenomonadaceae bacterium]